MSPGSCGHRPFGPCPLVHVAFVCLRGSVLWAATTPARVVGPTPADYKRGLSTVSRVPAPRSGWMSGACIAPWSRPRRPPGSVVPPNFRPGSVRVDKPRFPQHCDGDACCDLDPHVHFTSVCFKLRAHRGARRRRSLSRFLASRYRRRAARMNAAPSGVSARCPSAASSPIASNPFGNAVVWSTRISVPPLITPPSVCPGRPRPVSSRRPPASVSAR